MKRIMWFISAILITVLLLTNSPIGEQFTVMAALPVNPIRANGNFETGDLTGWQTGGTQNYSVSCNQLSGNHLAELIVGDGPKGDLACSNPSFNNFAYLEQLFLLNTNQTIELDFLVPLPAAPDLTENASCPGFDRVEINFPVIDPVTYRIKLLGNVTIDYFPDGKIYGNMMVVDQVLNKSNYATFDPMDFTPQKIGPLTLEKSTVLPGWLHASLNLNPIVFPWLSDQFTFRMSVRVEDNGYTGRNFSLSIDNLTVRKPACQSIYKDNGTSHDYINRRSATRLECKSN